MKERKFLIDLNKYFTRDFKRQSPDITDKEINNLLEGLENWQAIFILTGSDGSKQPDKYSLTDTEGNEININTLNGFQNGVVICDCYRFYEGKTVFTNNDNSPCGIIAIYDENKEKIYQF